MPKLAVLALQSFDPVAFGGRHTITSTAVRLSTPNPRPKRIRPTTNLSRNRFDRSRLAIIPTAMRQADKVKALVEAGVARVLVMEQLGISKASYYRCLQSAA